MSWLYNNWLYLQLQYLSFHALQCNPWPSVASLWSSFCSTEMFTLKLKMTSFKFKYLILQNKWTLLTMTFYKTKWLWMQKKTQTFTGVLVKRSYNNGFHSLHFTAISIDGTGVTFYCQNTINASWSVHSLFPGVAELSEISWSIGQFSCVGFGESRMWDTFALISSLARLYFRTAVVDRWPVSR
jgi:hypothetical protein